MKIVTPMFGVQTFDPGYFVRTNRLYISQRQFRSVSRSPPVLQLSVLLTEKNCRMLGCIRTTLDFFVLPVSSLHFEVLELSHGCTGCTMGLSIGCGDTLFGMVASRSRCLASSRWRAAFRALLSAGMKAVKRSLLPVHVTGVSNCVSMCNICLLGLLLEFFLPKKMSVERARSTRSTRQPSPK